VLAREHRSLFHLSLSLSPHTHTHTHLRSNVNVGTWNVNGKILQHQDVSDWLCPPACKKADIVAVGLQEMVSLNTFNVAVSDGAAGKAAQKWVEVLEARLGSNEYELVQHGHLVGVFLCVFAKRQIRRNVEEISVSEVRTGLGGGKFFFCMYVCACVSPSSSTTTTTTTKETTTHHIHTHTRSFRFAQLTYTHTYNRSTRKQRRSRIKIQGTTPSTTISDVLFCLFSSSSTS